MSDPTSEAAKLLIAFVGRHRGDRLVAVAKSAGARGGTVTLGETQAESRLLRALSLADIAQDVVFIVMRDEAERVMAAVTGAAAYDPDHLEGLALVLNVPTFWARATGKPDAAADDAPTGREKSMDQAYQLIWVIVNSGFANDVMARARKAGATGGTILGARGTGTEEDVSFFGITLVPEKEMLMIVAEKAQVPAIVAAVRDMPLLSAPGGGIVFTLDVEEVVTLGKK